jgi:DNA-directed RNA polymerase specialized sigma24 family protein
MLGEVQTVSSDLEWMLLSGQVSDKVLIEALVNEQYLDVFHLASSVLHDSQEGGQAAIQVLAAAVLNAHRYTGEPDVGAWCAGLALQTCRKRLRKRRFRQWLATLHLLSLGQKPGSGSPPARYHAHGQLEKTSSVSEEPPEPLIRIERAVAGLVAQKRQRGRILAATQEVGMVLLAIGLILLIGRGVLSPAPLPTVVQTMLVTRIAKIYPIATPVSTPFPPMIPLPIPRDAVSIRAEAGDTLRDIAKRTGVSLDILRALNSLSPDNPLRAGQKVILGFGPVPLSIIMPTAVTPAPALQPLTLQSDLEAIRQRVRTSSQNWHTLWAEFETIDFGPQDYIGRPLIKVWQVWYSQSFASLVLEGEVNGNLDHVWLAIGDRLYDYDLVTGKHSLINSGSLVSFTQVGNFSQMLFPEDILFQGDFKVLGNADVAGRSALELEWPKLDLTYPGYVGRYWVDVQTGLILRSQRLTNDDDRRLKNESVVASIIYDVPFPNRLFDYLLPIPSRLVQDYQGSPLPAGFGPSLVEASQAPDHRALPHRTPPPDFDPSHRRLIFQWTGMTSLGASRNQADVFAGAYYLGNVEFGDPKEMTCRRSPDGQRIAFTGGRRAAPDSLAPLRWFRLDDLAQVTTLMPEVIPNDLAFAPDSRRLAMYACLRQDPRNDCGVYVVDTDTGEGSRLVSDLVNADSFTWRPDGRALAFVGYSKAAGDAGVWVVDLNSGDVVYNGPVARDADSNGNVAPDSPTLSWGVPFPVFDQPRGVDGCVEP